jgi:adenylate kinase
MALRLVFIGPPGSGKGTQAKRLQKRGFLHVSSGDMLRAEIASGSERGQAIDAVVRAGGLVDDQILFEIVDNFLRVHPHAPIILDGYPRTVAQARHSASLRIDAAVFFQISDDVLMRRLANRVIGPDGTIYDLTLYPPPPGVPVTRRADDNPEVHRVRLATYRKDEEQLQQFYQQAGLFHEVRADLSVEEVEASLLQLIGQLESHSILRA